MAKRDFFSQERKKTSLRKISGGKEMAERCAECGAVLSEGSTCQTIFEEFLSLEYTDPAYGQVHFFTVACFMIQHGRYSDEALTGMLPLLRASLDEQLPAQQLRERAARGMNEATRTWKVTRQAGASPLPKIAWTLTIADVAQSMQDPEKYCEHVKQWARVTLQQMPALLR
ncbi:MAG TPA: hypothetical protein DEV72_18330 [Ktedonobacter sp.]|jgi:hypothetical protein|nr:hypothetical protein [Ktedonobacter sp.]